VSWVRGKVPPPGRLPSGISTRFVRPEGSVGDRALERRYNAVGGGDREDLRRKLVKYGKWHNPRKRDVPPDNMKEGWLVEANYPPRVYVAPPPEDTRPDEGGQDDGQDPQKPNDPQKP